MSQLKQATLLFDSCSGCPHYRRWNSDKFCNLTQRSLDSSAHFPDWCPLPDAKEKEQTNDTPR